MAKTNELCEQVVGPFYLVPDDVFEDFRRQECQDAKKIGRKKKA
jgi:hypothetical protein